LDVLDRALLVGHGLLRRAVFGQEATFDSRPKIVGNLERCQ
jgi:hypothetical protein